MMWAIKGKDNQTKASVHALEYDGEWMGESYVSVTVESPSPVLFEIGDYIVYRGERFEINYEPGKIKSAPRFAKGDAFKYENIKFNSLADELTRCDFLDVVPEDNQLHFTGLPKFSFYGGVRQLADRIQANLDRAYPGMWTVIVSAEYTGDEELNVTVDTQKVWDALSILVNDFKTYFTIKGRTITIGAAGVPAGHLFKYGKGNGLYEIEQNADTDQAVVTRLRAYGSTRNLPHRYYNSLTGADGKKLIPDNMAVQYLMLPSFPYSTRDPYIDSANKAALGVREGTVFFDGSQEGLEEIYPSIEGMTAEQLAEAGVPCNSTGALDEITDAERMTDDGVGEISGDGSQTEADPATFKVTVKDLGFDINDYLTTETATLSFKTGMLGGRDFEIVECKPIKNASGAVTGYEIELNRVYDDGIKLWFPYKDYNAKAGDRFVLLHIGMPEVYIKAASQRLLKAAEEWLAKNDYSRSVYNPKVDEIFMARQHDAAMASGGAVASLHDTLKEGMLLLFEDSDLDIDASIFIDRLTIREGDGPVPTYEVTLKEEKTVGRLDRMQNQIDSLASGGQGGYSAAQIRQMMAAYGKSMFLSKRYSDRTPYGLAVGGTLTAEGDVMSKGFVSGLIGWIISKAGGAELESLKVRSFMEVAELIVNRLTAIEGDQLFTEGDTIEEVTANSDGSYTLRLHEKWDGYFTAQYEHNVIKGIYNNITSGMTPGDGQQAVNNAMYYTSWMNVTSVDAARNEMTVVLYPDAETPAGRNFPPERMMKIARWGNSGDGNEPEYARRQTCFYLSSTEGRITKLRGVTKPIIDIGNIAATFGTLPEFLASLDPRIKIGDDGVYVKTLAVQNILHFDYLGRPIPTTVDRGEWQAGETYYDGTSPNLSGEYERSLVWRDGHGWLCNSGGVADASNAPAWNSTCWTHVQGDTRLRLAIEGFPPAINPRTFRITGHLLATRGGIDVTALISDSDITWTRYSEDASGNRRTASDTAWAAKHTSTAKTITLDHADLDAQNGLPPVCVFTVTAQLQDASGAAHTLTASKAFGS